MGNPMLLKDLNALIEERSRLTNRILKFDPPEPDPQVVEGEEAEVLIDGKNGEVVSPSISVCADAINDKFGRSNDFFSVTDETSERIRQICLSEWRSRVREIDGELANVRGIVQ